MISLLITDNASIRVQLRIDAMEIPQKKQKNPGIFTVIDISGLTQEAIELGLNFKQTVYPIDELVTLTQSLGLSLYGIDNNGSEDRIVDLLAEEQTCPEITIDGEASNGDIGTPDTFGTFTGNGGELPYDPSISEGMLPPGTQLGVIKGNIIIFGEPTEIGIFTFTLRLTDVNGCYGERQYVIEIE